LAFDFSPSRDLALYLCIPIVWDFEATRFDLNTFTNCLFALTGFWAVLGLTITAWFIMGDQARVEARHLLQKRSFLIGGYVFVWSTLYMLFAIFKN
jgi:hypothetical protein